MGNGLIRRNGFSEHWLRPWETLDRSMFDPIFPLKGSFQRNSPGSAKDRNRI